MANGNQGLTAVAAGTDLALAYGYEATAYGLILNGDVASPHLIWYVGSPAGLFADVPNGSMTIDSTNHHAYTKTGALGSGASGAWVINS
jgi:hypothetical protein